MLSKVRKPQTKINKELSSVTVGLVFTQPGQKPTDNQRPVKILLDSGSSGSIISSKHVKHLTCTPTGDQQWTTKAGSFNTSWKAMVSFILSELQPDKTITWEFHVDEGRTTHYGLLIGRDLLNEVGIDLLFSSKCISWEGHTTPMKDPLEFKEKTLDFLIHKCSAQDQVEEDFIQ